MGMYMFIWREICLCHVLFVDQLPSGFGGCVPRCGDLGDLMPVLCTVTGAQSSLSVCQNISLG